ncbi:hypothetical protein EJD97_009193 [Solanum chilense]|uniref:Uncharacterized protein n=2 Tax=Solanum subgen. Lycopersicon TaxID=49274 RepID=A0A3Q7H077_SOLLC|nr:hypothetical protein EJD97_009193 [Solanum chilense]
MAKKEGISMLEQNYKGYHLVHSQVKKIKQEEVSKNYIIDLSLKQPEMKTVLAREVIVVTRQHSRSRFGLNSGQPIYVVGDN